MTRSLIQRCLSAVQRRLGAALAAAAAAQRRRRIRVYLRGGRLPWSVGYTDYKWDFIVRTLADPDLMARFRTGADLPAGYGRFLDERVVEHPWLLARLPAPPPGGRLLDAGSVLNRAPLLDQPQVRPWRLSILTLAPESVCFWERGISYLYADLRDLPLRDGCFDCVVCVSTLEHVGMDNAALYTADARHREHAPRDYLTAARELARVLRLGGRCFITVPFGRRQDCGFQQQFDRAMLEDLIAAFAPSQRREAFFRYVDGGWRWAGAEECADCAYFDIHRTRHRDPASVRDYDPDHAAAARAVAALELVK